MWVPLQKGGHAEVGGFLSTFAIYNKVIAELERNRNTKIWEV